MLVALNVSNLALVEHAEVSFADGLTVWTGETGAGKSVLLEAIGLVTGSRGDTDLIRTGEPQARVEALFQLPDGHAALSLAAQWGIPTDDGELVITRELHRSGRGICRVNGRTVTVQMLRELGALLIQQQAQHEDVGLTRAEEQLRLLDLYGHHGPLVDEVRALYEAWREAVQAYDEVRREAQERERRMDMLNHQIEEIEAARLAPGEEEALRDVRQRLLHAERIVSGVQGALEHLQANSGILARLADAMERVRGAARHDASLTETVGLLETAEVHCQEAAHVLSRYLAHFDAEPEELERVEQRLQLIRTLERKYGSTVEDVLAYLDSARQERERWLHHEDYLADLEQRASSLHMQLLQVTKQLHEARIQAARAMSRDVTEILRTLQMPHAVFDVRVEQRTEAGAPVPGPAGADSVTFVFSANAGEPARPLAKIASGGELSRTLLAIRAVLAESEPVPTLLFDEIDSGVSGHAATAIASQLRALAAHRQVLCVTHSPQVAAAADHHYLIDKVEEAGSARTTVRPLDMDGRIQELARLIGTGESNAATALRHAQALLESYRVNA